MAGHDNSRSILQKCALITLLVVVQVTAEEICDKTKCPGPLRYYGELGCTPVHQPNDKCCPEAFDCSHLENLSRDKCYVNGHEYNIGESLKPEDTNPCDVACSCVSYDDNTASFVCAGVDCVLLGPKMNCFSRAKHDSCCPDMSQTCLKDGEERATCEVDGVTYYDGNSFTPKSDPRLNCICMPGYTGNNTEPFCKKSKRSNCDPLFRSSDKIHQNCVPVYYDHQDPQSDCSYSYRCQSADDEVISKESTDKSRGNLPEEHQTCRFGNLTMQLGDELSEGTGDYESYCMKCVCEVPPFPTCERIPFSSCDPMKYFKYPTIPIRISTADI